MRILKEVFVVAVLAAALGMFYLMARGGVSEVVPPEVEEQIVDEKMVTVTGEVICLPHKDSNGPVTLECAFGLKGEGGENFGLSYSGGQITETGKRVRVVGRMLPAGETKYDIAGTIEAESLEDAE